MAYTVNNKETSVGDPVNYVDQNRIMHEGTITNIEEKDGLHYADIEYANDGQKMQAMGAVHNTSPEAHSWNHAIISEQGEEE